MDWILDSLVNVGKCEVRARRDGWRHALNVGVVVTVVAIVVVFATVVVAPVVTAAGVVPFVIVVVIICDVEIQRP